MPLHDNPYSDVNIIYSVLQTGERTTDRGINSAPNIKRLCNGEYQPGQQYILSSRVVPDTTDADVHALYTKLTRIIQSLYYSPASRCINAWMHSLKKSVKPEILNRYDLWVLRHKIGGAKVFVNNVQWSDQMM